MTALAVALLVSIPWRWVPSFEIGPLQRETAPPVKQETVERVVLDPPAKPPPTVQVADDVVLRAIESQRAAFAGCYKRALAADPLLEATKVKLRLELDAGGAVLAVTHDAPSAKLGNCLAMIARSLRFPASQPAVAEFPLFFAPG